MTGHPASISGAQLAIMVFLALWLVACGGPSIASPLDDPFSGGYPTYRDEASGVTVILGTPDVGVGTFRVALALSDRSGVIRTRSLPVEAFRPGESTVAADRLTADFFPFPDDIRGLHTTAMTFDQPGTWTVAASVPRPDGTTARVVIPLEVAAAASAPVVGAAVPASPHRTAADVPSLDYLTTGSAPDPALYRHRIADSLAAHRPLVVIFTSPAFCTTPLCGPQVEEASDLARDYGDRLDIVHIDLFENPREIQGDLTHAIRSPLLNTWQLHTDQWTFVIGTDGAVVARFEAFVSRAELSPAIERALVGTSR